MESGKLLVAEDDLACAASLQSDLVGMGHQVVGLAASGSQAIEMARRKKPELVLMDIRLKGPIDGIEAACRLRRELDTPVVFISGFVDEELLERAKDCDPLGYLVKPLDKEGLKAAIAIARHNDRIMKTLKRDLSQAMAGQRRLSAAGAAPPKGPAASQVFAESDFLERLMSDHELAGPILRGFLKDIPEQIARLTAFIDADQFDEAARLATYIKGAAANISAERLALAAAAVETSLRNGESARFTELLPAVKSEFERLHSALMSTSWV